MLETVLSGESRWHIETADRLEFLKKLPYRSVDLVFGSPPYEKARTYDIDFSLSGQEWVDWMVETFKESLRVCKGLVAFVLQGQTKKFSWSATPALLMADLHRAGVHLRNPPIFHRVGIPGSGGPDWLRSDYEWIVCATNGGKLPWSDNTACGHPPKWAPGGDMSYRNSDGTKRNQWGGGEKSTGAERKSNGEKTKAGRPSHRLGRGNPKGSVAYKLRKDKRIKDQERNGDDTQVYFPPFLANPGNVLKYDVGGGVMGSPIAHDNEAPFPQALAEFFVRSFCPPDGIVCDPFSGSGTTAAAAIEWRRRFVGCDIRESQVELTRRRIAITQPRFAEMI